MIKIILTKGAPSSGKSTWATAEVAKDPLHSIRINNDLVRSMFNGSVYSPEYEKLVTENRNWLIKEAIRRNISNIIVDNVNANKRHFEKVCQIAEASGKDIQVFEKMFYVELDELLERDGKRTGKEQVGPEIVKKFWKELGGKDFKFYHVKNKIFSKRTTASERFVDAMVQDETAPKALICDLDGSIAEISHRSPYDASQCLNDSPINHVVEAVKLYHANGYKIIFCSGREDKYRDLTAQWLDAYVGIDYELFMRPTGNFEKDNIIKENIFNTDIKDKYYVRAIIDDRLQVCQLWYRLGLPIFRVGDPESDF